MSIECFEFGKLPKLLEAWRTLKTIRETARVGVDPNYVVSIRMKLCIFITSKYDGVLK